MRLLTAICISALVVAFAVPAFAETQNVKVSGDIAVMHVYQHDLDLSDAVTEGTLADANRNDSQTFFMQQVGLNVEADLTDNVSTFIRLINERDWDADTEDAAHFDVALDEAYVTLKEMLYAPLTVKIGRQNIWLGKGFVIGNAGSTVWDRSTGLPMSIDELSDMTAFDAIRATLDYDPWTIDMIYAKIDEDAVLIVEDTDLFIGNIGYQFTKYDAEAELYGIFESAKDGQVGTPLANTAEVSNETLTIGLRGSLVPFDNLTVWAEGAIQSGQYAANLVGDGTDIGSDRDAAALDLGGEYTFVDVRWTPKVGAEYVVLTGENVNTDGTVGGEWGAWNPLYSGKFDTQISAFRNITKPTKFDGGVALAADATQNNNGATNEHRFILRGSLNPMTDINVDGTLAFLYYDEAPSSTAIPNRDEEIGQEIDGKVTYDYTEDVQFALAAGYFIAGDYYESDGDDSNQASAAQLITAVTVDF